uniref:Uncharacterized protein n=1 Tax=Candidatus Nitrotoga fabula TaxID=2182327 RepID=A0A2X0QUD0_9PROT|nr:protein of unknown function [Candidatus Nitrotoga fabula]
MTCWVSLAVRTAEMYLPLRCALVVESCALTALEQPYALGVKKKLTLQRVAAAMRDLT